MRRVSIQASAHTAGCLLPTTGLNWHVHVSLGFLVATLLLLGTCAVGFHVGILLSCAQLINVAMCILQHDDATTASVIRTEKMRMLEDMVSLIRHRLYRTPANNGKASLQSPAAGGHAHEDRKAARQSAAEASQPAKCLGEFVQVRV
jgi:hypothetical protein